MKIKCYNKECEKEFDYDERQSVCCSDECLDKYWPKNRVPDNRVRKYRFADGSLKKRLEELKTESKLDPSSYEKFIEEFNKPLVQYEKQKGRLLEQSKGDQAKTFVPNQTHNYVRSKYTR